MSERFGIPRSLLQQAPSEQVWRALCEELGLWEEEERDSVALPYALGHLDKWPVEIQRDAFEELELWKRTGVVTPVLRLINAVWLNHPHQLTPLVRSPLAGWVRHVELWIGVVEEADLGARIARVLGRMGLVSLCLTGADAETRDGVCALLGGLDMPELRTLRLVECEACGDAMAAALADNTRLPALRAVELAESGLSAAGARSLARLGRLERLVVDGDPLGYRGAVALAGLGLKSLSAARCGFGPQSVVALAESAALAGLERLVLDRNTIGAIGARALAARALPARLTTLSLHDAGLRAADLRLLAAAPSLAALEELEVSGNQTAGAVVAMFEGLRALRKLSLWDIELDAELASAVATCWPPALEWPFSSRGHGPGALAALAGCAGLLNTRRILLNAPDAAFLASPHLANLNDLSLWNPGAAQLDALVRNEALGALRVLGIGRPTSSVAALLAARPVEQLQLTEVTLDAACVDAICAMGLRGLKLSRCVIEPAELARLLGSAGLAGLQTLSIFRTLCGDVGAACIAQNPALSGLRDLGLSDTQLGDAGVRALVGSPQLGGLVSLHLENNQIGDAGAATLANSPLLVRLLGYNGNAVEEQGVLMGNQIGDAGLFALMRSPHLRLMHNLDLRENPISEEALRALASDPALARLAGTLRVSGDPQGAAAAALDESALLGAGATVWVEAPEIEQM